MLKTSGQQDVWRTIFPSAIEIEYGGRYPADFCIIDYFISSDDCELVQRRRRHPLVAAYRNPSCARPASLCAFLCISVCFLVLRWNVPFDFGGTSLLIIVVVTMDFMEQARSYLMSQQYESLLRKANFKGGKFPVR